MLKLITPNEAPATVTPNTMSPSDWLKRFNLDWSVEKRPLYTLDANGQALKLSQQAIVRTDTDAVLNVVTERYNPIQNTTFPDLIAAAESEGLLTNLRGGYFGQGEKTWVQAEFGAPATVGHNDEVRARLLLANSHDGSFSFRSTLSPIRVVCMNTLMAAIGHTDTRISIRHTTNHGEKIAALKVALDALTVSFEKTMEFYRAFAGKTLNTAQVQAYVKSVLKLTDKPDADLTDSELGRMTRLIQLFESGKGQDMSPRTLWSAFNAVTEYTSHELDDNAAKRQEKLMFGQGADLNRTAFNAAIAVLKSA